MIFVFLLFVTVLADNRIDSTYWVEALQVSYVLRLCINVLTVQRVRIRQVNDVGVSTVCHPPTDDLSAVSASEDISGLIY